MGDFSATKRRRVYFHPLRSRVHLGCTLQLCFTCFSFISLTIVGNLVQGVGGSSMDSTSIITQVSRDEEPLGTLRHSEKGCKKFFLRWDQADDTLTEGCNNSGKKSRNRENFFRSLLCCFGVPTHQNNLGLGSDETYQCSPKIQGKYLLSSIRHQDMHKKCMVIDLDETLVHSSFKPISNADFIVPVEMDGTIHQVYVLKRPFVDEFLKKMGQLYECVLFTASLAKYADPVADLLDRWGVFRARLFRESCVFHRGNYVKDLGRLGRDLHKVVIVDNSPASYIFHPDNAVPVASWFDDMSDTELLDLIPFFESLSRVDNVYRVLRNSNNPHQSVQLLLPPLTNGNGAQNGPSPTT